MPRLQQKASRAVSRAVCLLFATHIAGHTAVDHQQPPRPRSFAGARVPRGAVSSIFFIPGTERPVTMFAWHFSHTPDAVGSALYGGKWFDTRWEYLCECFRMFNRLAPRGSRRPNFLDVGAHIGTFTVPVALCLDSINSTVGGVVAVEAKPGHVEMLRANLRVNFADNVVLFPYAVGSGALSFGKLFVDTINSAHTSLLDDGNGKKRFKKVPMTTLDMLLRVQPDLMNNLLVAKIDVEGYESHVLKGAEKLLGTSPPCFLMVELIDEWVVRSGTSLESVLNYLSFFGYEQERHPMFLTTDYLFKQRKLQRCLQSKI